MNFKLLICSAAVGLLAVSCMDDNYDLSDIDTTSRIEVNDLTIPVNLDAVLLSDIIKVDEDSQIKEVTVNGEKMYAVSQTGDFSSDPINIAEVKADAPYLAPSHESLKLLASGLPMNVAKAPELALTYEIPEMGNNFDFYCQNIDPAIVDITTAKVNTITFKVTLVVDNLDVKNVDEMSFTDVVMEMPKGMTGPWSEGTSYDPTTGIWEVKDLKIVENQTEIFISTSVIDFALNGCKVVNHAIDFSSQFMVKSGVLTIKPGLTTIPEDLTMTANYTVSDLEVKSFTGTIHYSYEGLANIDPVDLSNVPDFLDGNVDIKLANPLICLQTNNPVSQYGLDFSAGLTLSATRDDAPEVSFSTSNDFIIGHNKGKDGLYNIVLSPTKPASDLVPSDFRDAFEWTEFNFGGILAPAAGSGDKSLPKTIKVLVDNPQIPETKVTDFALGTQLDGVTGKYEFFAPLALVKGSTITYTDVIDGWSEDVEDLNISKLSLKANATNNTPLSAQITIYPVDVNGNHLSGVEITSTTLEAGVPDAPLSFELTGDIKGLDGIEIVATVISESENALSPDQTILLKNIRVNVTGYYQREL